MKTMKLLVPALVGASAAMGAVPSTVFAKEASLRAVSCFPIGSPPGRPYEALIKEINKRGKGVVNIRLLGGAPAIGSPFTLTQRMAKGTYDMVGCTESYFGNVFPEAPVLRLQEVSFATLRKNGGLDYAAKLMAAKNIHYVARHGDFGQFHLYLSKPITGPNLKGLHLRVAPNYTAFFKSLGATVQRAAMPQIYTLMENGTVQGYGWPLGGYAPAWHKVTKYRVDPGFYHSSLHTVANLRKWKKLSKAAQDIITKVGLEAEAKVEPYGPQAAKLIEQRSAWHAKGGIKTITFNAADSKKWADAARDAAWGEVVQRSPEHGPKLKALFTKAN